jgi:hypothetical protein
MGPEGPERALRELGGIGSPRSRGRPKVITESRSVDKGEPGVVCRGAGFRRPRRQTYCSAPGWFPKFYAPPPGPSRGAGLPHLS